MRDEELDELVTALLTASRALVGVSVRSLGDVENTVTPTQFRTLVVLHAHGPSRLNALSDRLHVNASTALRSVDRLIAAGLVVRQENPDDRREVVIDLTDAGRRLVADVTRRRRSAIKDVVRAMPPDQRTAITEALRAFSEAADEPQALIDSATLLGW